MTIHNIQHWAHNTPELAATVGYEWNTKPLPSALRDIYIAYMSRIFINVLSSSSSSSAKMNIANKSLYSRYTNKLSDLISLMV